MNSKQINILMLMDLSIAISAEEYSEYLKTEEWKNEAHIFNVLEKLGHCVRMLGLYDNLEPLIKEVTQNRPDLVFNMSEAFANDRQFEPHMASLLELFKLKYTGTGPGALHICKDKALTKKILSYHRISVPKFVLARKASPLKSLKKFCFPAFIKPLQLEASEGIAQLSFAENESDAIERVRYVNEKLGVDAIVEEYIEGRELYVGVLGNERLTVFPPRELFFREVPEGEPKFATFKAKWDESYRNKWGIDTDVSAKIDEAVLLKLKATCKKIYRLLKLRGYGRIDLRLKDSGEIYFIEANPNPSIAKDDDFALAAAEAGYSYENLIAKILSLSGAF